MGQRPVLKNYIFIMTTNHYHNNISGRASSLSEPSSDKRGRQVGSGKDDGIIAIIIIIIIIVIPF